MKRTAVVMLLLCSVGACRDGGEKAASEDEIKRQVGGHPGHGGTAEEAAGNAHQEHGARTADEETNVVRVDPNVAKALGIRTVGVRFGAATAQRRAPATVTYDPARRVRVTAQPGGQVRALDVPRVGESVKRGAVMARLYSPEVSAAFEELLLARELGEPWMGAARQRLRSGGVLDADVDQALAEGRAPSTYSVRAPVSGVVTARTIAEGAWMSPGGVLAVLAQSGAVVVEVVTPADHPEVGTRVKLADPASGAQWDGRVEAVLSTGDAAGHAVRVAVAGETPRVGRPLVAEWDAPSTEGVWVPRGAVVDTGERRVVFVSTAEGGYSPRDVKLGARTAEEIQVVEGLAPGERVVAAGTFLLDSETQMTSAGHAGHGG